MKYILVKWIHDYIDEPVLFYCELDDSRFETRRVEIYANGEISYASSSESNSTTILGEFPVPSLSDLAKDPHFEPTEITQEEFEKVWLERKG